MNNWDNRGDDESHFPTIDELYSKSKIDIEEYYRNCCIISYKTANSQYDCEKMEYWKFNNLLTFLNEILTTETGGDNKQEDHQQGMENYKQQAKAQQRQAMANAKSYSKIPKFK